MKTVRDLLTKLSQSQRDAHRLVDGVKIKLER